MEATEQVNDVQDELPPAKGPSFDDLVAAELEHSFSLTPKDRNAHESYAHLAQALDAFWHEVKKEARDRQIILKRLVEIAANAKRAVEDNQYLADGVPPFWRQHKAGRMALDERESARVKKELEHAAGKSVAEIAGRVPSPAPAAEGTPSPEAAPSAITDAQRSQVILLAEAAGWSKDRLRECVAGYGKAKLAELSAAEAEGLIAKLTPAPTVEGEPLKGKLPESLVAVLHDNKIDTVEQAIAWITATAGRVWTEIPKIGKSKAAVIKGVIDAEMKARGEQ